MEQTAESTPEVLEAASRSQVYHLLAQGFKYPTREMFKLYQDGNFITELMELLESLPHLMAVSLEEAGTADKIRRDLESLDYQEFEVKYVNTFDVGFPEPPCPPYNGLHMEGTSRSEVLIEVAGFYKHFGLAMSQGENQREQPDYLSAEMEFLHFLAFKEARARLDHQEELLNGYLLAQTDFLKRHMLSWFPTFYKKVQEVDQLRFYPDLARIILRFTEEEYEFLSSLTTQNKEANGE